MSKEILRVPKKLNVPEQPEGNPLNAEYEIEDLKRAKELCEVIFSDFLIYEKDAPEEARILMLDMIVTEEMRNLKLTNLQVGTRMRQWISTANMAKIFFPVLNDRSLKYDKNASLEEKENDLIAVLLAFDKMHQKGHSRFIGLWRDNNLI